MTEIVAPVGGPGSRIDRRTFLKLVGAGALGALAAESAIRGGIGVHGATDALGPDPIDSLALELEFDAERIFRYVADEIAYEPYPGVLRGPGGTLASRAGNAADQATLLAALLGRSGIAYRFAIGVLGGAATDALLGSTAMDLASAQEEFEVTVTGSAGEGSAPAARLDPALKAEVDAAVARAAEVVAWGREELATTVRELEAAVGSAGLAVHEGFSALPDAERERHVWVQMAAGPDWVDLDPSIPGTVSGAAIATASTTVEALPPELRHVVRFEVIAEVVSGAGLREETLLDVEEFADVLGGQPIGFLNIELGSLKAVGAAIATALSGGTTYLPCLLVGEGVIVGPGALRFGGDAADDPFGSTGASGPLPDGEPLAEWLRITIASPGAEPVVVRRAIFDRLGPSARAGGSPDLASIPPVELITVEPESPPDYLPAQRTLWLNVATGREGGERLQRGLTAALGDVPLPGIVTAYHLLREAGGVELGAPEGVRTVVDRPNIAAVTLDQELSDDGTLLVRPVLDILHRSHATLPVADVPISLTPSFVAGVLPHVVERILVGDAIRDPGSASTASVGAVFAEARQAGIGSRVVSSGDVVSLPFAPEALARLDAAVADGAIAVVPERPVVIGGAERVGWWIIDPATGHTFDQMDDGRGTAAEDMTIIIPRVRDAQALRRLRQCQILIFLAALGVLFGTMAVGAAGGAAAAGASGNTTLGFALLGAGGIGGGSVFEDAALGC